MQKLQCKNFNFKATLLGGQAFNWDLVGDTYYGVTNDQVLIFRPIEDTLFWETYPTKNNEQYVKSLLRLDESYEDVIEKIKSDQYVSRAIEKYPNIRILKQDFEQTLLSFIISANNNIKAIRRCVRLMNSKFGKPINVNGIRLHLFPDTKVLAEADLDDLLACSLGFRAKYIKEAAQHLIDSNLANRIYEMSLEEARNELLKIKGIGNKIADCILIFALGFTEITPIDVWGKRVLTQYYNLDPKMNYEQMRNWLIDYFDGQAAWAGQFLFEYIRDLEKQLEN